MDMAGLAGHGGSWLHMAEHPMVLLKTPHVLPFMGLFPPRPCPTDCPIDCPWSAHSLSPFKTHNSHRSTSNGICYYHHEARPHSPEGKDE